MLSFLGIGLVLSMTHRPDWGRWGKELALCFCEQFILKYLLEELVVGKFWVLCSRRVHLIPLLLDFCRRLLRS